MKKRNIPEYRFSGYTDDWEQRKLGEVGTVAMNKRIFKEQTSATGDIPFFKIGTFGGEPDSFISRELFEEYKSKYPYPEKGDLLLSASGSIGRVVEYEGEEAYFQDSNIVWLNHSGNLNNLFLKQFYENVTWDGIEGTTIKRLYNKNILNTEINLPSLPEQESIGNFFRQLDDLLTLHQRQLDLLKERKKTYLKLLFPAQGQKVPALRFDGFEGEWEETKLADVILSENKGKAKLENKGELATYLDADFLNGGNTIKVDVPEDVTENDLIILWDGSQAGTVYKGTRGALGSTLKVYRLSCENNFIYYQMKMNQKLIYEKYRTPNIPHVINTFTKEFSISYTSFPEQKAIGNFFSALDQEMAQVESQLVSLKDMKATLLRKLFL